MGKILHSEIQTQCNWPVIAASENGHLKVVNYLHQNGAKIHTYNNFAVMMALRNGHLKVVKYLQQNGAAISPSHFKRQKISIGINYKKCT